MNLMRRLWITEATQRRRRWSELLFSCVGLQSPISLLWRLPVGLGSFNKILCQNSLSLSISLTGCLSHRCSDEPLSMAPPAAVREKKARLDSFKGQVGGRVELAVI